MTFEIKSRKQIKREMLTCRYHFRNREKCQHYHYIYYQDLYETVLKQIQRVAKSVDSGELLKAVQRQTIKQNKKEKLEVERNKLINRLALLSKITKKLYEDHACDLLDTDSYHKMLHEYQQEQKQLSERLSLIQSEQNKKDQHIENVQKLSDTIKEYLNVDKLNANMLNQLIERIEIGHPITIDGVKQQEINIIYRFVGTTI